MRGWLLLFGAHDVGSNTGTSMENENDAGFRRAALRRVHQEPAGRSTDCSPGWVALPLLDAAQARDAAVGLAVSPTLHLTAGQAVVPELLPSHALGVCRCAEFRIMTELLPYAKTIGCTAAVGP